MKTTQGAFFLASAKSSLTLAAPLPTYSSTNSDAEAAKKGTPASPATALAARTQESIDFLAFSCDMSTEVETHTVVVHIGGCV